jgi:hypothetical protein
VTEGYQIGFARCFVHGDMFEFDPETVCTIWVRTKRRGKVVLPEACEPGTEGAWQVLICDPCMVRVNEKRAEMNLPPFLLASEMPKARKGPAW